MTGKLYGLGVGPGDPELLTLKALRLMKECEVIAVPGKDPKESVAYKIAQGAYEEIYKKEVIAVEMPMTKDTTILLKSHEAAADIIEGILKNGKNVAFLT